jgi:hypothetical protein
MAFVEAMALLEGKQPHLRLSIGVDAESCEGRLSKRVGFAGGRVFGPRRQSGL